MDQAIAMTAEKFFIAKKMENFADFQMENAECLYFWSQVATTGEFQLSAGNEQFVMSRTRFLRFPRAMIPWSNRKPGGPNGEG
jgi:hypothetical protein